MFAWMTRYHHDYTMSSHSSIVPLPARHGDSKDEPETNGLFPSRVTRVECTHVSGVTPGSKPVLSMLPVP